MSSLSVVLINPYELGRQPFGLAQPAAMLKSKGCSVACLDLSLQPLNDSILTSADLIAIYVAMHTATRIAIEALPKIRQIAPNAHICLYGLYAPMNAQLLFTLGAQSIIGGEFESALLSLVSKIDSGQTASQQNCIVQLDKVSFEVPDRDVLPPLQSYAHLILMDNSTKVVGFAETTRGCKHVCRHCPVVPIYQGRFFTISQDIVLADIQNQVAKGAEHISFGDPDFLNGPTHARRIVTAMHAEFPHLTYDFTAKIEHILKHRDLVPYLRQTGCLFITSAVESIDDDILLFFDKRHTSDDFTKAVEILSTAGVHISPTFVAFTPWTSIAGYRDLLYRIYQLGLVDNVAPVQLTIRLLIPEGSMLLELPDIATSVGAFDASLLSYPWKNSDPKVDKLQRIVQDIAATGEEGGKSRREIFQAIWHRVHRALDKSPDRLNWQSEIRVPPHMSEPWYCCAEPTDQQLMSF